MIEIVKLKEYRVECPVCGTVYTHDSTDLQEFIKPNFPTGQIDTFRGTFCPACKNVNEISLSKDLNPD